MSVPPSDSYQSEPDLRILHTLRCIGFTTEDRIAAASGMEPGVVATHLRSLADAGLVDHQTGPFGGWGLTEAGRTTTHERLAEELEHSGARDAVLRLFEWFMDLNPVVLTICHNWQMRTVGGTSILNDHRDSALDRALAGDRRFVTDRVDSYHTVWFQLHEDLLTTLAKSRDDQSG